jgi:hypothetical protein
LVSSDPTTAAHRNTIIALAAQHRLPAVYPLRLFVTEGGLMCYAIDLKDLLRQAASYVDRVLRGTKPADLPVQAPTKYETVPHGVDSASVITKDRTEPVGYNSPQAAGIEKELNPHLFTSGLMLTADFSRTRIAVASFSARCGSDFCDALWVSRMVRRGGDGPGFHGPAGLMVVARYLVRAASGQAAAKARRMRDAVSITRE